MRRLSDKLRDQDNSREGILELFQASESARSIILAMAEMEKNDTGILREIKGYIQAMKGKSETDPVQTEEWQDPKEPNNRVKKS